MFEAPLTNESFPLKHVLGWEGGGGVEEVRGLDLTLTSLLRTWLSLKHHPSFRALILNG